MDLNNRYPHNNFEKPLVSILVPAHNAESTIILCLDSVYAQDYRPIELVVINDGSTDKTAYLIEKWITKHNSKDFSSKYVSHENKGLLACRNEGLSLSSGNYLQFLDADDCLHQRKLSICMNTFRQGEYDVVVPYIVKFTDDKEELIKARLHEEPKAVITDERNKTDTRIANVNWGSSGPVFKRSIVEESGKFYEILNPVSEEMVFHARIKSITRKIAFLPYVLSFYRVGGETALTNGIDIVYKGRIDGANALTDIFLNRNISDSNEWRCLINYCIITLYRSITQTKDHSLCSEAHESLVRCAKFSPSVKYQIISWIPLFLYNLFFKVIYLLRKADAFLKSK